jgi:hypothetical protein
MNWFASSTKPRLLTAPLIALPLLLGGCGNSDENAAGATALQRVSQRIVGCPTVRTTPSTGVSNVPVNTSLSVQYSSANVGTCGKLGLLDASGAVVALKPVVQSEWNSPIDGVASTQSAVPVKDLPADSNYRLTLGGTVIGTFTTGPTTNRRGTSVLVADETAKAGSVPQVALVNSGVINDSLYSLAYDLANQHKIPAHLIEDALGLVVPNLKHPGASYGARIKRMTYTSTKADGTPVTLSGLLVYPEREDGRPMDYGTTKLVLAERGSQDSTDAAPSTGSGYHVLLGALVAGKGYIYFEPDLIGMGATAESPQAYLVSQDAGTASEDMLLAVRDYFAKQFNNVKLPRSIYLAGASQGGHSVFAALPYISAQADVLGVYAGAGPYDLFQTFSSNILAAGGAPRDSYAINENQRFVPGHVHDVLNAFSAYEGLQFKATDIFAADGSFTDSFLSKYKQSGYPDIVMHMGRNSFIQSSIAYDAPKANVVLFHHPDDTLVPAQNTTDMISFLNNGKHNLASVNRGNCHENSALIKLIIGTSKSALATHTACAVLLFDRIIGDLK